MTIFKSQWVSIGTWKHHVLAHGLEPESADIFDQRRRSDGSIFNFKVRAVDGCEFWVAPWELSGLDTHGPEALR